MDEDRAVGTIVHTAACRYAPDLTAPRLARHFVDEFLRRVDGDDLCEDADLLISEVVSDAVRHTPSQICVHVGFDRGVLRVEVSDDPGIVKSTNAGKFERRVGRQLCDTLASRWGSDLDRGRTTTWFELAT